MAVDITKVAQKLLDELEQERVLTQGMIEGVRELHERIRRETESANQGSKLVISKEAAGTEGKKGIPGS